MNRDRNPERRPSSKTIVAIIISMIGLSILIAEFVLAQMNEELRFGARFVMIVIGGLFVVLGSLVSYLALEKKENRK